jgi:hypothetical protein
LPSLACQRRISAIFRPARVIHPLASSRLLLASLECTPSYAAHGLRRRQDCRIVLAAWKLFRALICRASAAVSNHSLYMAYFRTSKCSLGWFVCGVALTASGCFAPRNRPWLAPNEPAVLHQPAGGLLPSSDPALDDDHGARAGSALASRLAAAKPAPDPQALHEVVTELQAVGAVDPAAQAKLLQDLERTNPSLWPEVLQAFRARRTAPPLGANSPFKSEALSPTDAGAMPLTARLATPAQPPGPWSALEIPPITKNDQVVLKDWPRPSPTSPTDAPLFAAAGLMATNGSVTQSTTADSASQAPAVSLPEGASTEPGRLVLETAHAHSPTTAAQPQAIPPAVDSAVRQVSFTTPASPAAPSVTVAPLAQGAALASAISALEATTQEPVKNAADAPRHAQLRLLYLAAGRREDALRPIAGLSATEQDYWDKQLRAMATWMDVERIPDGPRRAAEASQRLAEASTRLSQLSSLGVRNMAFCTDVSSYGVYTRFKENNFAPGQQVLLYAEVENFKSVETHRGYHTMLKTSYQILDSSGSPVVTDEPQAMEEYCQNPRRDYFVRYRLHLPKGITSGRYRLQLTIHDTLGEKSGVSNIEFTVTTQ